MIQLPPPSIQRPPPLQTPSRRTFPTDAQHTDPQTRFEQKWSSQDGAEIRAVIHERNPQPTHDRSTATDPPTHPDRQQLTHGGFSAFSPTPAPTISPTPTRQAHRLLCRPARRLQCRPPPPVPAEQIDIHSFDSGRPPPAAATMLCNTLEANMICYVFTQGRGYRQEKGFKSVPSAGATKMGSNLYRAPGGPHSVNRSHAPTPVPTPENRRRLRQRRRQQRRQQ